jgi:hypothetical protein
MSRGQSASKEKTSTVSLAMLSTSVLAEGVPENPITHTSGNSAAAQDLLTEGEPNCFGARVSQEQANHGDHATGQELTTVIGAIFRLGSLVGFPTVPDSLCPDPGNPDPGTPRANTEPGPHK